MFLLLFCLFLTFLRRLATHGRVIFLTFSHRFDRRRISLCIKSKNKSNYNFSILHKTVLLFFVFVCFQKSSDPKYPKTLEVTSLEYLLASQKLDEIHLGRSFNLYALKKQSMLATNIFSYFLFSYQGM